MCIYIYAHIQVHECVCVCWFAGLFVCWFVGLFVCLFACVFACVFVCVLVCWFVCLLCCLVVPVCSFLPARSKTPRDAEPCSIAIIGALIHTYTILGGPSYGDNML